MNKTLPDPCGLTAEIPAHVQALVRNIDAQALAAYPDSVTSQRLVQRELMIAALAAATARRKIPARLETALAGMHVRLDPADSLAVLAAWSLLQGQNNTPAVRHFSDE